MALFHNRNSSTTTTDTMQSWIATSTGKPEKILRLSRIAKPTLPSHPSKPTYLIRVAYAALNPRTSMVLSMKPAFMRKSAVVPEVDFSGVIHGVTTPAQGPPARLAQGSRIFGQLDPSKAEARGVGTLNEWIVVGEDEVDVATVPEGTSLRDAASLGMGGVTALQMMRKAALASGMGDAGKRVLVNGASGGVGTILVQILKATGATVVAVCSAKNADLVKRLGADEIVDYRSVNIAHHLPQAYGSNHFDAILDTIGDQELYEASPKFLKEDGPVVSIGGYGGQGAVSMLMGMAKNLYLSPKMGGVPRKWLFHQNKTTGTDVEQVADLVRRGKVEAVVGEEFRFEDVAKVSCTNLACYIFADGEQAFEVLSERRTRGKIVIKVADQ